MVARTLIISITVIGITNNNYSIYFISAREGISCGTVKYKIYNERDS